MLLRMTGIWFLCVEVLGRVGVSGGSSEDLVLCRVGGSVGELVFTISENLLKASSKYMWDISEGLCAHARNF